MWQNWVGLFFLLLGALAGIGAINAYRTSVGTPYYAGIVGLATFPGILFFISIVFFAPGVKDLIRKRRCRQSAGKCEALAYLFRIAYTP
jgi:hypothetical protein